jgi:signal transduction histidine kinase
MPTSSEFVSLSQAQVALLTQALGAALSIVYLTEEWSAGSDKQLIPVVAHPEAALNWGEEQIVAFLTQLKANLRQRLLPASISGSTAIVPTEALLPQQQVVLPLIYQERVMGLLITARAERAWTEAEQDQIDQIAQTLTMACILDRRSQWLSQDVQRQQLLDERKTDLYDDLLHQFRNPLTALRTFGKLLVKRLNPSDANRSVVDSMIRESDRLQELLKQLDAAVDLDLADLVPILPSGEAERDFEGAPASDAARSQPHRSEPRLLLGSAIELQPHSVTEVLQPLLDSASAIAQDRQIALEADIPPDLPPVLLDQRALREVANNLIDNALKYTPAGGQVYVTVQRPAAPDLSHRQAMIVADTGPGIPPEDLRHLFTRHYRGVQAQTEIPGSGLGLAIAQELIRQMQGEVQLFSPAASCGLLNGLKGAEFPRFQQSGTAAVVWLSEAE